MPFKDTNTALKVPARDKFQVGRANVDDGKLLENNIFIPWPSDPQASWVYYDCTVGVMLDSGIAIHNRLPQVNRTPDTLASCILDDAGLEKLTGLGVNLKCQDQYQDIMQRMGHARYWFRIWGQALRVGYQVPIPGIKTIGGVATIPYDRNPQWAFNRIAPGGNWGGVILWHAAWSLWYTTLVPPTSNTFPAADPSGHIDSTTPVPKGIQVPFSGPDDEARIRSPVKQTGQATQTAIQQRR